MNFFKKKYKIVSRTYPDSGTYFFPMYGRIFYSFFYNKIFREEIQIHDGYVFCDRVKFQDEHLAKTYVKDRIKEDLKK